MTRICVLVVPRRLCLTLILLAGLSVECTAFVSLRRFRDGLFVQDQRPRNWRRRPFGTRTTVVEFSQNDNDETSQTTNGSSPVSLEEVELSNAEELDMATLEEIEQSEPSEWMIMKELLGINIFTFILAGLITFFLSMNIFLGPGWLGNSIGIQGTGSFEEVSPSLPDTIDLNKPQYRL